MALPSNEENPWGKGPKAFGRFAGPRASYAVPFPPNPPIPEPRAGRRNHHGISSPPLTSITWPVT